MPAIRNEFIDKKSGGRSTDPVQCSVCSKVLNRRPDLTRHMLTHKANAKRFTCEHEGCGYSTLQRSNFNTHLRTHTGEKRYVCQDVVGCPFRSADPAALTRHRKKLHGYVPRSRKSKATPAGKQATATATDVAGPSTASSSVSAGPSTSTSTLALSSSIASSEDYNYSSGYSSGASSPASVKTEDFYPSPVESSNGSVSASSSSSSSPSREASVSNWANTPEYSFPPLDLQLFLTEPQAGLSLQKPQDAHSHAIATTIYEDLWAIPQTSNWNFVENALPWDWMFLNRNTALDQLLAYPPLPFESAPWNPFARCDDYYSFDNQGNFLNTPNTLNFDYPVLDFSGLTLSA